MTGKDLMTLHNTLDEWWLIQERAITPDELQLKREGLLKLLNLDIIFWQMFLSGQVQN